MTTTMSIGRSASSSSVFAAVFLLVSVQQHRDGSIFHFAHALENVGDIDSAPNNGAATQTRRRTPGRGAPSANPFRPDYMTRSCKNDKAAESWVIDPPSTVGECCERHFQWTESECEVVTQQWLMDQMGNIGSTISDGVGVAFGGNAFDSNGAVAGDVVEYYPDSTLFVCKVVTAFTPTWITARENDYEDCCTKWFKWNPTNCLNASPLNPVSGVMINALGDGSSSGNGENNSNNETNSSDNTPANTTANNWGFPTHCENLTKKHCKRSGPYCSWMNDPSGEEFCASPYLVNAEGYSYYCSGRERDDCEGEQRCEFNKKKGCLAMIGSGVDNGGGSSSGGGGGDSSSGNGAGEGTPGESNRQVDADNADNPCQSLAYGKCAARADVCRWNTKNNSCTALPKISSSNANDIDSTSPTCVSFGRAECVARPNECKWRQKKGCLPLSPKSNHINDASNKGNITPRTGNPTTSPMPSPTKMQWYYVTGDGMCKPNSKDRPKRIETVYDDHEECCDNSGDYAKCMNEVVEMLTDNGDGNVEGDGEDGGDEATKYWYNPRDGMCKPDRRKRPKWITTLYEDFEECCEQSWSVSTCLTSMHPDKNKDSGGEEVDSSSRNLRGPRDM